jgi:hypothetical protein
MRVPAHDCGVETGVRGRRNRRDQRVQVRRAPDTSELAALLQLIGDGEGIGGLAAAVQVEDRLVDGLVRGAVEVVPPQHLDDVGDRVLGQEHAAEHRLLGCDVLWRCAVVAACRMLVSTVG